MKKRFKNNFQPRQFLWSYYIFLLLIVIKKVQRHSCKEREEVKRRSLSRRVHAKRARLQFQLSALAENSIRRGSSCFSSNGLISNYRDIYLSWRIARSQGPRSKLVDSFFHLSQIIFCFADNENASRTRAWVNNWK